MRDCDIATNSSEQSAILWSAKNPRDLAANFSPLSLSSTVVPLGWKSLASVIVARNRAWMSNWTYYTRLRESRRVTERRQNNFNAAFLAGGDIQRYRSVARDRLRCNLLPLAMSVLADSRDKNERERYLQSSRIRLALIWVLRITQE